MTATERPLGRSGLATTPLMLGGNVFDWTADRDASFAVLDAFLDGGGKLIDTAAMYSNWIPGLAGGESESMIGEWQASRRCRDRVLIATKVGRGNGELEGLSRATIVKAVDASLRRLRTDYIDLYFAHLDDSATPLDETLRALGALVGAGKVQAMSRADFEGPLQQLCVDLHIGVVLFYALASGFLTGKYRSAQDVSDRQRGAEGAKYVNAFGLRVLGALDTIAAQMGASQAQVALAWLMAQPGVSAPIASATSAIQMAELTRAMWLKLDSVHLALLTSASAAPDITPPQ